MTGNISVYNPNRTVLMDAIVTQNAVHEEELMRSDFIRLSWNDAEYYQLPVGAYIIYNDVEYTLFEPYEPSQKNEAEWVYEPQFQHPKMYLGKVPFIRPTKDSSGDDINLIDWAYTGFIGTLLGYFCEQMDRTFSLSGVDAFEYKIIGTIDDIVTVSFSTVDILSALTAVANTLDCEWHIDWYRKRLYFGHVMFDRQEASTLVLQVGGNVGVPSVRNSREGYWNAFEAQGSTRNITRRAASGEYVSAGVRLSLMGYNGYSDGIIYSLGERDSEGKVRTYNKAQFDALGAQRFVKTIIFENVFPKLDLYAYNIKYRERYLLEDNDDINSKVIDHYEGGVPVYKRYAVWYMRLAYKDDGEWKDFDISDVRDFDVTVRAIEDNDLEYHFVRMTLDMTVSSSWFTNESQSFPGTYIVRLRCGSAEVKGYVDGYYFNECRFYAEYNADSSDDRDERDLAAMTAFQNALSEGCTVTVVSGMKRDKFPKLYSQIIDGKELYCQFKVNTSYDAETSPLAGRGSGDGGNYGFALTSLAVEGADYIANANAEPVEDGDTGIVNMNTGSRDYVTESDYEIVFQQSDDYILPTTLSMGIIPKGENAPSERNNIVNLYNIVMGEEYEQSAKGELEEETLKYIENQFEDNNSYTFKSNPIAFKEMLVNHTDYLYIGKKVTYKNGDYELDTRVMKIVTKLDYDFEQEITVGNEVLKGSQQTLKEQVSTIVSGGAGGGSGSGSGGAGGSGLSPTAFNTFKDWADANFLSKTEDDEAHGLIGFLKGAYFGAKKWMIDALGNANLNDITFSGILRGGQAVINKIKSSNYSGDGMLDTGWQIINDYEGTNSKAVFDYLYIRKKAIFEELEIRKMTYIGGNFVFSPASGRIWRVEAYKNYQIKYDSQGEQYIEVSKDDLLGYSEVTVPYMLGGRILSLFRKLVGRTGGLILGKKKLIARKFTPEEIANMKMVRCYLFSDDGSTETMNWWKVGAQARCQTFNIDSQVKWDGERHTNVGTDVANTYWWRLVSGTGRGLCDDGETHEYVDFLIKTGSTQGDKSVADAGSDVPMVGDQMVQMGHRTNPQYANVIIMETVGGDAPAFKEYRGIMGWDLTGTQKTKISPTTGTVMYSTAFHIETEYGDVLVPKDRGRWLDIPYTQGTTERRCYYYDRVEHNGSLWLCITPEGTYTTIEPGDSTTAQHAVWQKQVSKGDKGEASFKSSVFKRATSKPDKPADNDGSYANPVPSGWSDGIPSGTDTIWMTTRVFSTDGNAPQQSSWTAVQLMSDTESFDVEFSPVASNPGNPTDNPNNWYDPTTDPSADWVNMIWMAERTKNNGVWGNWKISKIKGEQGAFKSRVFKRTNTDISTQRPTGGSYESPIPTSGGWTDGIPSGQEILWSSVRTFDVSGSASEWSLPAKETDTATLDIEFSPAATCPAKPTGDPFTNREPNWYDPTSANFPTAGTMIWRAERKVKNGAWEAGGDWVMTRIYGEKGDSGNFKSTVFKRTNTKPTKPSGGDYTTPVPSGWSDGVPDGDNILWASTNVFYSTGGSSGWTEPKQMTDTADFDVEFSSVASPNPPSGHPNTNTQWSNTSDSTTIWMATSEYHNGVWGDWQVSKIKGEKGDAGNFKSTVFKRTNTTPNTPSGGDYVNPVPSGWSDGVPNGQEILWASTNVFYSTGGSSGWTAPKQMTDTADFDVEFSTVESPNPPSGHPNTNTQWSNTANENTIWMATSEYHNGVWGNWQVSKIKGEKGDAGAFKSRVFKRTNTDISNQRPTGGTYASPWPTSGGWSDGIPNGTQILWSSVATFLPNTSNPTWSLPAKETDTADIDIEFSLSTSKPNAPTGSTPHADHSSEGWYDPSLNQTLPTGKTWSDMWWRAERKVKNGAYEGDWVITQIKGEAGQDATTTYLKYTKPKTTAGIALVPTISNYYQFTWTDTIPEQTEAEPDVYVGIWKATAGQPLDISTKAPTSVSIFAHYGEKGDPGKNGTSIVAAPNAIVINQQKVDGGAQPLTNVSYPITVVARDSGTIVAATISNLTTTNCTASISQNGTTTATVTITAIDYTTDDKGVKRYKTSGAVSFKATAQTAAGQTFTADISVPFGCNLLGQYTVDIEEDVKTEIASKVTAEITKDGVLTTTNFDNKYENASWGVKQDITKTINELKGDGTYDRSTGYSNSRLSTAEGDISKITKTLNGQPGGMSNTRLDTAESSIQTLKHDMYDADGNLQQNYSTKSQTADAISLKVNEVSQTLLDTALGSSGTWEQGGIGNDTGYSYSNCKIGHNEPNYIRTKSLTPMTGSFKVIISAGYVLAVYQFGSSETLLRKTDNITGSSSITLQSDVYYVALEMRKSYSSNPITPDDVVGNFVTAAQLSSCGIDIGSKVITMNADNMRFQMTSGTEAQLNFDLVNDVYKLGAFEIGTDCIGVEGSGNNYTLLYHDGRIRLRRTDTTDVLTTAGDVTMNTAPVGVYSSRYSAFTIASADVTVGTTVGTTTIQGNSVSVSGSTTFSNSTTFNSGMTVYGTANAGKVTTGGDVHVGYALKVLLPDGSDEDAGLRIWYDRDIIKDDGTRILRISIGNGNFNQLPTEGQARLGEVYLDGTDLKVKIG